jgi:hypothetical protein
MTEAPETVNAPAATPRKAGGVLWHPVIALILLALPLIYFFPAVRGQVMLAPGDGWTQIFGIRFLIGQMLKAGQLPFWNPYIFAGMPLLASLQPGALYPPNWLPAVLPLKAAVNVIVILAYHVTLIGTYLFARRSGCTRIGALLAGIAFTFGGYMVAHLGHTNRIAAAAWLPWILLAIEQLYQQVRWRWVMLGALFIALQLFAGEPQMTLYTVMVAVSYGLFSLVVRERREARGRFIVAVFALALGGVLLSMIQLLPAREFLAYGDQANIDYNYFSQFSFPPRQLFSLFFPYYFGGAATFPYRVPYWGRWSITETLGYVGMATWLLAFAALFAKKLQRGLVWFWVLIAVLALLLAFGGYLPFGLNHGLFQVPVYRLFHAPGRHLFEFTFALGMLAGLGATALAQMERHIARRVIALSSALLGLILAASVVVYRFYDERLVTETPLPPEAGAFSNPDLYVPLIFFVLSALALWLYPIGPKLAGGVLVLVLLLDTMAWGICFEWRLPDFNLAEQLSDPPAVKLIKEREPDWHNFRIFSHASNPFGKQYREFNYPNVSLVRGLQSINGYDPLRMVRVADVTGNMTLDGRISEASVFDTSHHGFDLLNVKYMLREKPKTEGQHKLVERAGIQFDETPIDLAFSAGKRTELNTKALATELAAISSMGNSDNLTNGQVTLRIKLHTSDGRVIERELQAGRDTSEWAYDRADVRARVQHDRANVIESWTAGDYAGHRYLARLGFDRAEIVRVELQHQLNENARGAEVSITQMSLFDAQTNTSTPLNLPDLPSARWRKLQEFDGIEVVENLRTLPRAWFVRYLQVVKKEEVLAAIKTGKLPDGTPFDPKEVALFETEQYGARARDLPTLEPPEQSDVRLVNYTPHRIELQTRNAKAGFLVLSEVFYRGWEASLDGGPIPVEQVDYLLRGVRVPAGEHRIEFKFAAHSFRRGAWWSLAGVMFLLVGAVWYSRRLASDGKEG